MLKDPKTSLNKKFKLEWDIHALKEDVRKWKQTILIIDETLAKSTIR